MANLLTKDVSSYINLLLVVFTDFFFFFSYYIVWHLSDASYTDGCTFGAAIRFAYLVYFVEWNVSLLSPYLTLKDMFKVAI